MTLVRYLAVSINLAVRSSPLGQHCWIDVMYFCCLVIAVRPLWTCIGTPTFRFSTSKCQEELCVVRVCPAAKKQAFQLTLLLSFTVADGF